MEKDMSCLHLDFLWISWFLLFSNCGSLMKAMVHSWFGARWFGLLGSPSVTSGVPLWIPNHRAPNQEFIGWRKSESVFFLCKFHSLPSCFGEVTVLGTSFFLSKFGIPKRCPAPTVDGLHFTDLSVAWQNHPGWTRQVQSTKESILGKSMPRPKSGRVGSPQKVAN